MKNFKGIIALIIIVTLTAAISASAEMLYLGQMADYGLKNACAVFSTVNCINSLGGNIKLENAVALAKDLGWTEANGMEISHAEQLASKLAGIQYSVYLKALTVKSLISRLEAGKTVAVAIDSNAFWNGKTFRKENHLISVLGVETDESGDPVIFHIIDSGLGRETMTVEELEGCTSETIWGIVFLAKEC